MIIILFLIVVTSLVGMAIVLETITCKIEIAVRETKIHAIEDKVIDYIVNLKLCNYVLGIIIFVATISIVLSWANLNYYKKETVKSICSGEKLDTIEGLRGCLNVKGITVEKK